ncbi:MAG: hypothetical protein ACE5G1_09140 [bacterium]
MTVKNMETGEQQTLERNSAREHLKRQLGRQK